MTEINLNEPDFLSEIEFKTSRSGGKGGQHVNKVESKVELRFNVNESQLLDDEQKDRIRKKLKNRINKVGELMLTSDTARTQNENKKKVIDRFFELLREGLKKPKKRKPTKIPAKVKEKRLEEKQKQSEKKERRKDVEW